MVSESLLWGLIDQFTNSRYFLHFTHSRGKRQLLLLRFRERNFVNSRTTNIPRATNDRFHDFLRTNLAHFHELCGASMKLLLIIDIPASYFFKIKVFAQKASLLLIFFFANFAVSYQGLKIFTKVYLTLQHSETINE